MATAVGVLGVFALVGAAIAFAIAGRGGDAPVSATPDPRLPLASAPLVDARLDLARRLNLSPKDVSLSSATAVAWDGCYGVQRPGQACRELLTGGVIAFFEAKGKTYRYHLAGAEVIATDFLQGVTLAEGMTPPPGAVAPDLTAMFAAYAQQDFALQSGVPPAQVTITGVVPAVPCPAMADCISLTSKYGVVVLESGGAEHYYRLEAAKVTPATREQVQPTLDEQHSLLDLERRMREDLASHLHAALAGVSIRSYQDVTWPDGCLGVHRPGEVCAQVLVEGFRALLVGPDGREYRYHGAHGKFIAATLEPGAVIGPPYFP